MSDQHGYVQRRGRVLRCVIATAAHGNTLDFDGVRPAREAISAIKVDGDVGAVLLASEGGNFCNGGDVRAFAAAEDRGRFVGELARTFHEFILALVRAPVPVVAGVRGWAVGAGMSIACACDVVVGGPSTRFRPAYPSIGLSPDGGMSWALPRIIGATRARDLILTDGVLAGEEALRAGLLTRLVADQDIQAEAEAVAAKLADGPTSTYARIKRLMWDAPGRDLAEHLDAEAEAIAACADSSAGREGVDAFAQRRAPTFTGRHELRLNA